MLIENFGNKEELQPNVTRWNDADGWRVYEVDGKKYISVTQILSCVVHERLKSWFIKNSSNSINKRKTETASIGTAIHAMVENSALNNEVEIPEELKEHAKEWERIKQELKIKPIKAEFIVKHDLGWAGQVDLYGDSIYGKTLFDVKSGRVTSQAGWQCAAYKMAMEASGTPVDAIVVLQIPRDGSEAKHFKYDHIDFCEQRFLCAFECFKGLYWKKLESYGFNWKEFSPTKFNWGKDQ